VGTNDSFFQNVSLRIGMDDTSTTFATKNRDRALARHGKNDKAAAAAKSDRPPRARILLTQPYSVSAG
jgi:hypothetical protein